MFYKRDEKPGTLLDRSKLIALLIDYYKVEELDGLRLKLKNDLKKVDKLRALLEYTKYEVQELLEHLMAIFGKKLFNLVMTRKLNAVIKLL